MLSSHIPVYLTHERSSRQANKMNEQESLEDLSDVLVRLSDAFTQSNGRPPKRLDIDSRMQIGIKSILNKKKMNLNKLKVYI